MSTKVIAKELHASFLASGKTLALAESCTGGAIAAALVEIPDASKFLLGSIVAYSDAWKESFLGVSSKTLREKGAVSREVVGEMVAGLFARTEADFALAVSGLAGQVGGPIYIAIGKRGEKTDIGMLCASANRKEAIDLSANTAMAALLRRLVHNQTTFQ